MNRVDRIAKNVEFVMIRQILVVLTNFVVRKIFLMTLGAEYLGVNGLFADILSMLSLAELGFGTAIIYSLYRPVALGDQEKIKSLIQLYRRIYLVVGAFILVGGILLTPYLNFFVKEMPESIPNIPLIYILNVVNAAVSYLFTYKASILFVDQKRYIQMIINTIVTLAASVLQAVLLVTTGNYILYLMVTIASTLVQNIWISIVTDKSYPYLKEKEIQPLEKKDLWEIKRNAGVLLFHKMARAVVFSTDNILMAKFVGVQSVGLYSNYVMIKNTLSNVINMAFSAFTASMGNLNVVENDEKKYQAFNNLYFFSSWVFGFMSICLLLLYNPFIELWLGAEYLFSWKIVLIIVVNFYLQCMRTPVNNTKEAMGLFWDDRYKPVAEMLINLFASIFFAKRMGIFGVLLGTFLSTILAPFWIEPLVLYHKGLKRNAASYFLKYGFYLAVTVLAGCLTGFCCHHTPNTLAGFILKAALCVAVPNLVFLAAYHRMDEMQYMKNVAFRLLSKVISPDRIKK